MDRNLPRAGSGKAAEAGAPSPCRWMELELIGFAGYGLRVDLDRCLPRSLFSSALGSND